MTGDAMNTIPKLYLYDPKTKELLGQRDAAARPRGRGYILQATFATPVAPPDAPAGYAARWMGEAWELVEDHRQKMDEQGRKYGGTPYWLPAEGDTWQSPARYVEELGPLPEGAVTVQMEKTPEEVAAAELAAAQAKTATIITASLYRNAVQTMAFSALEFATFAKAGLFDEWKAGETYVAGYRLTRKGVVYEVVQDVTAQEHQAPDAKGMLAVYRPLSNTEGEDPAGTAEDPVPFIYGMDVKTGLYYSYGGKLYLAKADMPACVWTPDTSGLWQWEEVQA